MHSATFSLTGSLTGALLWFGLGEAVFGAVLLGATTPLPGSVASLAGDPDLAVSNTVGGIAAQTVFCAGCGCCRPPGQS
ncbi:MULTISPECIES: hypothetical protein [Thiorhodovibrio]|uniref:hypothetical protein n=1 Tax=Thiorhodovibrio TaxID=61593 RepID=UPI001F5CF439|nr:MULTISPECIES: hypothetical protein [Thiorhodovibrio]WPL13430.1 hypothetical protein Thiosp_03231 [Thiorhodovibrio litoralis]